MTDKQTRERPIVEPERSTPMSSPKFWLATDEDGGAHLFLVEPTMYDEESEWGYTPPNGRAEWALFGKFDDHPLAPPPGSCIPVWLTAEEPDDA